MQQGSDEWKAHRLGKVTASRVADVLATTRSGPAASRQNYMTELLLERLTGVPAVSFVSPAMAWGTEHEPRARAVFEFVELLSVEQTGFIDHATIKMFGCSPDGLVGDDHMLEIKCPNSATHWETFSAGVVPSKYKPQIQSQLACAGRDMAHFVSFDPRFPEELMYFHATMERDSAYIAGMEKKIVEFLAELDAEEAKARNLMKKDAA